MTKISVFSKVLANSIKIKSLEMCAKLETKMVKLKGDKGSVCFNRKYFYKKNIIYLYNVYMNK